MHAEAAPLHTDEVLTGEAVALDVQPLGYFLRALGAFIDALLSLVLFGAAVWLVSWLAGIGAISEGTSRILMITALVLCVVVVPTAVETASRGRSLGRLIVGGRVVRVDGGAATFRHAFIRALVGVLEIYFTLGGLALIVGAFTPRAQRLGDIVAGTYSERTRTPPLPPSFGGLPPALAEWAPHADVGRLPAGLARRLAQFVRQAHAMAPGPRARLADELAAEAAAHVSPVPAVDPETFLRGVAALRRDRELRAFTLQNERVATLVKGGD